jgi:hypothetical protein
MMEFIPRVVFDAQLCWVRNWLEQSGPQMSLDRVGSSR